jgi:hypothetical protein
MAASGAAAAVFHAPSDRDTFLFQVALNFKVPELCDRIDARADSQQIGAVRSKRSVCHAILKGERHSVSEEVPWDMAMFAEQVRALGYSDADMRQSAHGDPYYGAYQQLLDSGTFRARVRGGPSYAEPRDRDRPRQANVLEFLYQKVAIDKREPALCAKISPNATFTDHGDVTVLLHSRCYLNLAFNLRDAALCQPLPAAGSFPLINEGYDSRDKCLETVKIYARPSFKSTGTYGPYPFVRADDLLVGLREIGYAASELPSIPGAEPEEYWEFVSRLKFGGPVTERAEFVRRTMAMK